MKSPGNMTILPDRPSYALVLHGGAGTLVKSEMTPEREAAYLSVLTHALDAGEQILKSGGTATEAVCAVVTILEDSPLFNAGKGSVFSHEGINEMDASIMQGKDLMAGAVTGVTHIRNPILAARAVMEKSPHVMLSGAGAETFAKEQGLELVDPSYFYTRERWEALQKSLQTEALKQGMGPSFPSDEKFGTVGCVALDQAGNLAAATSTGGMTNKRWNRIGDSPVIGCGTYANNRTCAVSCTGHGEFFIRYTVAHDVSALMDYGKLSLQDACDSVIHHKLKPAGGEGGLIAVDRDGNVVMSFNSKGMYRGYALPGKRFTAIFQESGP